MLYLPGLIICIVSYVICKVLFAHAIGDGYVARYKNITDVEVQIIKLLHRFLHLYAPVVPIMIWLNIKSDAYPYGNMDIGFIMVCLASFIGYVAGKIAFEQAVDKFYPIKN